VLGQPETITYICQDCGSASNYPDLPGLYRSAQAWLTGCWMLGCGLGHRKRVFCNQSGHRMVIPPCPVHTVCEGF
jgi:hypothetical protein